MKTQTILASVGLGIGIFLAMSIMIFATISVLPKSNLIGIMDENYIGCNTDSDYLECSKINISLITDNEVLLNITLENRAPNKIDFTGIESKGNKCTQLSEFVQETTLNEDDETSKINIALKCKSQDQINQRSSYVELFNLTYNLQDLGFSGFLLKLEVDTLI